MFRDGERVCSLRLGRCVWRASNMGSVMMKNTFRLMHDYGPFTRFELPLSCDPPSNARHVRERVCVCVCVKPAEELLLCCCRLRSCLRLQESAVYHWQNSTNSSEASSRATVSERSSKGASAMPESFRESPSVTMTSKHLFSPAASQQFCVVLISNFQKSSFFL